MAPIANPEINILYSTTTGRLELEVNYSDPDSFPEQGTIIEWYQNGTRVGALDNVLQVGNSYFERDELWYASVRPRNNHGVWGTWTISNSITIATAAWWGYWPPGVHTYHPTPESSSSSSFSSSFSFSSSSFSSSSFSSCSSSFSSCSSSFSSSSFSSSSYSSSLSSCSSSCSSSISVSLSSSCSSSFSSSSFSSTSLGCEYIYAGLVDAGVSIIDVSDKTNPVEVGYYDWIPGGWYGVLGVETRLSDPIALRDICFMQEGSHGLRVLDVTDKANPIEIGYLDGISGLQADGRGMIVDEPNDILYAVVNNWGVADDDGLIIVDVSDPTNPLELSFLQPIPSAPCDVIILDSQYVVIGNEANRLDIVDVSNPLAPFIASGIAVTGASDRVFLYSGHVYCAAAGGGVTVVDVSNPLAPVEVFSSFLDVGPLGYCRGINLVDGRLYMPVSQSGDGILYIWELSNPAVPTIIGSHTWPSTSFYEIEVSGDYAYIVDQLGLIVANVSNPASISETGYHAITQGAWVIFYRRTNLGVCFSSSSSSCSSSFSSSSNSSSSSSSSFSSSSFSSSSFSSSSSSFSSSSFSSSSSSFSSSSFSSSSFSSSSSYSSSSSSYSSSSSSSFSSSSFSSSSSCSSSSSSSFSSSSSSDSSTSSSSSSSDASAVPLLQVVPTDLDFWYNASSDQITITNIGGGTLNWSFSGMPAYLSPDIPNGSLGPSDSDIVTLTPDRSGLAEGSRTYDSFTVISNDGNQVVTTHVMKLYSFTCSEIEALNKAAMSISVAPVDAATRGTASYNPATSYTGLFQPDRGGWDISISGTDSTNVVAFAIQNKMWTPFVTGTQFQLVEQTSYDVFVESVDRASLSEGDVWYIQYAYRSGAWEYCTTTAPSCSVTVTGTQTLTPSDAVVGSASGMSRWMNIYTTISGSYLFGAPYGDDIPYGVAPSDHWSALDEWALDGGWNVIAKTPPPQGAPPRAASSPGKAPLYYHQVMGDGSDATVIRANQGIDTIWAALPGVSMTDGRISITVTSGANWHADGNWLNWSGIGIGMSIALGTTLRGGPMYLDMSGGEEGQTISLNLSNSPYLKWFNVGMDDIYDGARPYGYLVADYVGYANSNPFTPIGTVPGADYHYRAQFERAPAFWWGTNMTGPGGSAGVQMLSFLSNPIRLVLKKVGSNWVVQFIENGYLINTAKNAVIAVSY